MAIDIENWRGAYLYKGNTYHLGCTGGLAISRENLRSEDPELAPCPLRFDRDALDENAIEGPTLCAACGGAIEESIEQRGSIDAKRWLGELFEYENCGECGGGAENHCVVEVPGIGLPFAQCIVTCDDYETRRAEVDRWLKCEGAVIIQVGDLWAALIARYQGETAIEAATVHLLGEWNDPIPPGVFAMMEARDAARLARRALGLREEI